MMQADTEIRLGEGDHVVQFYEHDEDLVAVVVGYLAAALSGGDAVVAIATPPHRAAFEAALAAAGIDSGEFGDDDRLVLLDAEEALAGFMAEGAPDAGRFDAVVGEIVRRAAATGRPVRAYGEMVAILWGAGNRAGALALERLWNDLGAAVPLALFCAYPSHMVNSGDALVNVCHLHTRVVAGTPPQLGAHELRRFARTPQAPRLTRRFVCDTLLAWGLQEVIDDAALVVSELASNAVTHGASDISTSVTRTQDGVRIAVADRGAGTPLVGNGALGALGGRGLILVDAIADRWGHAVTDEGKVVWADLAVPPTAAP